MEATTDRTVLIADDDPGIRESLSEVLRRSGWNTFTVEGGREAVTLVRRVRIRVAVVDMRMGDMTGLETLRELQRVISRLPVVTMTAETDLWRREDVIAAGAFELLAKPLRRDRVVNVLERALRAAWETK